MEASNRLKVITFKGPAYEVEYIPIMTTGDLKAHILQIDHSVPDFDFIYAGRMIRANDKVLEDFVRADNMTIYTNAKGVHGGCGYGCGWMIIYSYYQIYYQILVFNGSKIRNIYWSLKLFHMFKRTESSAAMCRVAMKISKGSSLLNSCFKSVSL